MKIDIKPRYAFLTLLFIFLVVYSLYQARFLILGPKLTITKPQNGEVLEDPVVTIEGVAKNISWISLNDRQIFTDENGYWSEELIVSGGTSIMTIKASDRLGRERVRRVEIFLPTEIDLN